MYYDPEAVYQDADIAQAELEREDRRLARLRRQEEPDFGGAFDGSQVTSDADPGL